MDDAPPPSVLSDRQVPQLPQGLATSSYLSELSTAFRNAVATPVQQMFVTASGAAEPVPTDQTTGLARTSRLTPRTQAATVPFARMVTTRPKVLSVEMDARLNLQQPDSDTSTLPHIPSLHENDTSPFRVPRRLDDFDDEGSVKAYPDGNPDKHVDNTQDGGAEAETGQQQYHDDLPGLAQAVMESTLDAWSSAALPQLIRSEYELGELGGLIDERIHEAISHNKNSRRIREQDIQTLRSDLLTDLRRSVKEELRAIFTDQQTVGRIVQDILHGPIIQATVGQYVRQHVREVLAEEVAGALQGEHAHMDEPQVPQQPHGVQMAPVPEPPYDGPPAPLAAKSAAAQQEGTTRYGAPDAVPSRWDQVMPRHPAPLSEPALAIIPPYSRTASPPSRPSSRSRSRNRRDRSRKGRRKPSRDRDSSPDKRRDDRSECSASTKASRRRRDNQSDSDDHDYEHHARRRQSRRDQRSAQRTHDRHNRSDSQRTIPRCPAEPVVPKADRHLVPIIPVNRGYRRALDYKTYRLLNTSPICSNYTYTRITRFEKDLRVQMQAKTFDGKDPIRILSFLHSFQNAADTNGLHEGAAMWLIVRFMSGPAHHALNARLAPAIQAASAGKLTTYCQVIQYLLQTYASDEEIARVDAEVKRFVQQPNQSAHKYALALYDKTSRCGPVYTEEDIISLFVEGLHESIRGHVRAYWSESRTSDIYKLARVADTAAKLAGTSCAETTSTTDTNSTPQSGAARGRNARKQPTLAITAQPSAVPSLQDGALLQEVLAAQNMPTDMNDSQIMDSGPICRVCMARYDPNDPSTHPTSKCPLVKDVSRFVRTRNHNFQQFVDSRGGSSRASGDNQRGRGRGRQRGNGRGGGVPALWQPRPLDQQRPAPFNMPQQPRGGFVYNPSHPPYLAPPYTALNMPMLQQPPAVSMPLPQVQAPQAFPQPQMPHPAHMAPQMPQPAIQQQNQPVMPVQPPQQPLAPQQQMPQPAIQQQNQPVMPVQPPQQPLAPQPIPQRPQQPPQQMVQVPPARPQGN